MADDLEGPAPNSCTNQFNPLLAGKDVSGETNVFSPEWSGNLNLDYRHPLGENLELRGIVNVNYSDEFVTAADLDPLSVQDSFTKVDLRLSLGQIDGVWEVAVIGKNITDEDTSSLIDDQPLVRGNFFGQTDRLRSWAVQATYRFW